MKKHLNFLCFLSILFLYGCGFEPILSSKNINKSYVISIDEINFKNYNELNNLFLRKFRYFQKDEENLKKFNLVLNICFFVLRNCFQFIINIFGISWVLID